MRLAVAALRSYHVSMNGKPPMNQAEREDTRRRLRVRQQAQPLLEEQRWLELRSLTDEKALGMTKALFSRKVEYRGNRDSSGLVEQQALFHRLLKP